MSLFTRRRLIAAAPASGLAVGAGLAFAPSAAASSSGQIELTTPFRLQDSRINEPDKYDTSARDTLGVPSLSGKCGIILNVTVTETEGAGFFRIGEDFEDPPATSNINWYTDGQTLANMAIVSTPLGLGISVQGGGSGRAHLIIDVLGYIT